MNLLFVMHIFKLVYPGAPTLSEIESFIPPSVALPIKEYLLLSTVSSTYTCTHAYAVCKNCVPVFNAVLCTDWSHIFLNLPSTTLINCIGNPHVAHTVKHYPEELEKALW